MRSGLSWVELTNGPISYFIYEEPPGALTPTCPGVGPLVSMCERLFGKSGSFGGEGWFPWDTLAKWGIVYQCQCLAAAYPHAHRFRIWKSIYYEKKKKHTHASQNYVIIYMTQADFYEGTHMHTPNFNCQFSFYNKLDRNPIKI